MQSIVLVAATIVVACWIAAVSAAEQLAYGQQGHQVNMKDNMQYLLQTKPALNR